MPRCLDMRVLADLLELRPAATLHVARVFLPIDPVILFHVVRLGLLRT